MIKFPSPKKQIFSSLEGCDTSGKQIVQLMRNQLDLDNRLDEVKVNLARSEDFNLQDAFRVFDDEGKGWVTSASMLAALTKLNIAATTEDLYNFMKRYDKLDSGRLKYSDFCDAFIPLDPVNANRLCRRQGRNLIAPNIDDIFSS